MPSNLNTIRVVSNKNNRNIEGLYYEHSSSSVLQNVHERPVLKYPPVSSKIFYLRNCTNVLFVTCTYTVTQYTGGIRRCCQTLVCVLHSGRQVVGIKPTNYIYIYIYFLSEGAQVRIIVVCITIPVSIQE